MDYVAKWTVVWRDLPLMAGIREDITAKRQTISCSINSANCQLPTFKEIVILALRSFLHVSASEMQFTEVSAVQKRWTSFGIVKWLALRAKMSSAKIHRREILFADVRSWSFGVNTARYDAFDALPSARLWIEIFRENEIPRIVYALDTFKELVMFAQFEQQLFDWRHQKFLSALAGLVFLSNGNFHETCPENWIFKWAYQSCFWMNTKFERTYKLRSASERLNF